MSPFLILYFHVIFSDFILASTVKWLPNSSFKLPLNYKDGKLPCSKQTVVFPQTIIGSIKIESPTEVEALILPEDGELVLDAMLTFGSNPADTNCTEGNNYYMDKSFASWYQADVWSSPNFNKATPDSERVPCYNDIVEFPADAKFSMKLPKVTQYVKNIKIGNVSYNSSIQFLRKVLTQQNDEQQQFIMNDFLGTGVLIKSSMSCSQFGCPCQVHPMAIDCTAKFCPKPTCVDPIKPLGFCCEICGGYLAFKPDNSFDILDFHKFVEETVNKYGKSEVEYHIGVTPEVNLQRIQVVLVDKGDYEGASAEIVNSISYALHERWVLGHKVAQISGSPLYKSGLGGKIFVSMFFAVILTLGAMYVYYYTIPDLRFPIFSRNGPGNVLSRFQRRSDSIVSLTRRDSVISRTSRGGTAFRNPLYDSKRGRVEVAESVVQE